MPGLSRSPRGSGQARAPVRFSGIGGEAVEAAAFRAMSDQPRPWPNQEANQAGTQAAERASKQAKQSKRKAKPASEPRKQSQQARPATKAS